MQVIPSVPPEEPELLERIKKLVAYVARNGGQFEAKVREKEASNPSFGFLVDETSEYHFYYKWMLFNAINQYTADETEQMESKHNHKLEWKTPGTLDLTSADERLLKTLLLSNNGSKDDIKNIRKWVLDRSHSAVKIGRVFRKYIEELGLLGNTYNQMLHTAYVINDLFYNSKVARSVGPYTRLLTRDAPIDLVSALLPNVSSILRDCYLMAEDDAHREKVTRLIELWTSKGFVTEVQGSTLRAALSSETVPAEQEHVELTSPYLENPLPSHAPPTAQAPAPEEAIITATAARSSIPDAQLAQLHAIQQKIQQQLQQQQLQQQHAQHVEHLAHLQHAGHGPPVPYPQFVPVGGFPGQLPLVMQHGVPPPGLYPPAMFPPPTLPQSTPFLDLAKIPVGNMANIVRAAKRAGHPPNTPLDVMTYASHAAPHVEPGRVEVRIADFYKHVELLFNPAPAKDSSTEKEAEHRAGREDESSRNHKRQRDDGDREESWVKYVPGYEDEKERSGQEQDWHRHARKGPRLVNESRPPPVVSEETEIAEDNVGHKLLRGLGWQQGLGLGAASSGIVEPISAKPASDRGGIGMPTVDSDNLETLKDGVVDYSAYRKQRSTTYHSRISDRDTR